MHNLRRTPVDLGGLSLSDRTDQPRRWVFPTGTKISPGGFLVVAFDNTRPASDMNTGFGLNANGDSVYLFDRPENNETLLDALTFGIQAAGLSLGRASGARATWKLGNPSPGVENNSLDLGPPDQLKINEWMADPLTGNDWFEVFNPGTEPVELSGFGLTDDLADPTKSVVPALSFIGSGKAAYQLFVADDQSSQGPDHVGFKLSGGGEAIGLALPDGTLIDAVEFGTQEEGVSEGRLPDGSAQIVRFPLNPTPGTRNTNVNEPELGVALLASGEVLLEWKTAIGLRYAIERRDSLSSGNWATLVEITADDSEVSHTDRVSFTTNSFYRLRIVP